MSAALPDPPITIVGGMMAAIRRLSDQHGITVQWEPDSGTGNVGGYDGFLRILTLCRDDCIEDQLWVLHETLNLCLIGEHAVPAAQPRRHLRVT